VCRPCASVRLSVKRLLVFFMKFGAGVIYKRLSIRREFRENRWDIRPLLKGVTEFLYAYFLDGLSEIWCR
jgi:hypothetical protein